MSSAAGPEAKSSAWNIPNALTAFRLVLVPLFAVVLLTHPHDTGWRIVSTVIFVLAIFTDFLDGRIARKYNIITTFGKLADPIADKALTGMAFIGLSIIGELWWWVTIIILIREWGITLLRFVVLRYGVMAARKGGKIKTVLQSVALGVMLLPLPQFLRPVGWVLMAAALIITVVTGVDYLLQAYRMRRAGAQTGAGPAGDAEPTDRTDGSGQ
jgi:CDP-diacylglycerol---glycerol-3-phosphate 3-phosphatidyltransferase